MSASRPLSYLSRLSRSVYLYRPAGASTDQAPKLILLATWMGAQDAHIAKYIEPYRRMYPASPILLLRNEASDFFIPRDRSAELRAAADVVRAEFPDLAKQIAGPNGNGHATENGNGNEMVANGDAHTYADAVINGPRRPELLIHLWSNGGSTMLSRLRSLLLRTAPSDAPDAPVLPAYTLVMDSAPGSFHYRSGYSAFSLTAPKWLRGVLSPFLHAFCSWFWLISRVRRLRDWLFRAKAAAAEAKADGGGGLQGSGPLERSALTHNDRRWLPSELRRTYVYSDSDALIPATDVEKHAAQAEARGFKVRRELFHGTPHIAHARVEPERYWRIARETWEGDSKPESKDAKEEVEDEAPTEAETPAEVKEERADSPTLQQSQVAA